MNHIVAAVERGVRVELLMSEWDHTRPAMLKYLASLQALDGVTHNTHIKSVTEIDMLVLFEYVKKNMKCYDCKNAMLQ